MSHDETHSQLKLVLLLQHWRGVSWRSWRCWGSILLIVEQIFNPSDFAGRAGQHRPVSIFSRRTRYMYEGIPNFNSFRWVSRKVLKQIKKGAWVGKGLITEWKKLRNCVIVKHCMAFFATSLLHSNLICFNCFKDFQGLHDRRVH